MFISVLRSFSDEMHTWIFVGPVAAVRHSVAARRRGQAASAVGARESVRVTRDQVTILLVRVVAAVVVPVAAPSARDAAIQPAGAANLVIRACLWNKMSAISYSLSYRVTHNFVKRFQSRLVKNYTMVFDHFLTACREVARNILMSFSRVVTWLRH